MSAQRHRRVRPGSPSGYTAQAGLYGRRLLAGTPIRTPSVCDYCAGSMTGQEFRGDKCLDCRVRDGEAEVDENGEEIVEEFSLTAERARADRLAGDAQ